VEGGKKALTNRPFPPNDDECAVWSTRASTFGRPKASSRREWGEKATTITQELAATRGGSAPCASSSPRSRSRRRIREWKRSDAGCWMLAAGCWRAKVMSFNYADINRPLCGLGRDRGRENLIGIRPPQKAGSTNELPPSTSAGRERLVHDDGDEGGGGQYE